MTNETNPAADGYHGTVDYSRRVTLAEVAKFGARISRVRILTEYNPLTGLRAADVSYIHATKNGVTLQVQDCSGVAMNLWGKGGVKENFIAWAKAQGVSAKAIGLLDESVWSIVK